jgi:arabinogalactan oligomer / maltooligosaccharide transport system substrate-binding protein
MEFTRVRALGLALAILVVVAATAVTGAAAKADKAGTAQATTTITFWQTMNEEETTTLKGLVSQFERSNPGIKIRMVTVPFDQAQQRYRTAAQARKGPDVLRAEIAWIAEFAARGFLADLSRKISAADRRDFLPAAYAYGIWNGKAYSVPQVTDAPALLYNKAMLRSANVAEPKTMDQLVAACRKFGDGKGIFLRGDSYFVQPWIWAYGGGLLNPLKKEILIARRGSINGLTQYVNLFRNSCAFQNKDFANDYTNMQTAFKNGEVAMIVNGPWATSDILSGPAFKSRANLGIAPVPGANGGQGSPVGGHNYVISRSARNLDAAYRFISWLSNAQNQAVLAQKNNLLPTRKSAYNLPAVKRNPIITAFGKQMQVARNRPVVPQGGAIYTDFTPNIQKALTGDSTPDEALVAVANAWKQKLFPTYTIVR